MPGLVGRWGPLGRAAVVGSVAALGLGGLATVAVADPGGADRPDFTLTVLHSNDMESQLLGTPGDVDGDGTIGEDEQRAFGGVARFATVVDELHRQATRGRPPAGHAGKRAALVLSSGDNFLAGPEFAASLDNGVPYYDALAMAEMGYDVSVLGNHEFDFGPEVAADFIESVGGRTDFISANLDFRDEPDLAALVDDGSLTARTVVKQRGERIGLIGLTTPALRSVSSPRDVQISDELGRITDEQVAALQDRGVDKIILVSHLQDIDNERALVAELDGVDAVVGGGGGELLANEDDLLVPGDTPADGYPIVATDRDGTPVPIVTTPGEYEYVGRLVLHFDGGEVVGWDDGSGPVRVSGVEPDAAEPDPVVTEQVVDPVRAFVAELDEAVVADSEVDLDGVRESVRSRETNLGNLLADALRWEGARQAGGFGLPEPQVAVQNGGGIRNDSVIPAGPITALDTFDVAPFANFVAVVPEVPPQTLKALLERGFAAAPDPAGQFTQVSGLSVSYDPAAPAQQVDENTCEITAPGQRVQDVVLIDGTVVVEDGEVVAEEPIALATNDFSARGGDCYPLAGLDFTAVGKTYQQALQEYLQEELGGTVSAADYPEGGEGRITTG